MTESQTYKKRSDFQSNDDYAMYVRENIQVGAGGFEEFLRRSEENANVLSGSGLLCRWG